MPKAAALSVQRQRAAWLTLVVGLPLLLGVMALLRDHLTVGTELLLTLSLTVTVAAIGGLVPGLVGAVLGALSVNWALVSPYGTLDIHDNADTLSLGVFVLVAIIVSTLVDQASRRAAEAARARGDAQALSRSAMVLASSRDPLSELAQEACTVLRQHAVAIFERTNDGGWERLATAGEDPPAAVADGTAHPVDEVARHVLVLHGRSLDSNDVVLLEGLADQIAVALESTALRREAAEVEILGRANALRNAILQAVSHDLRTPLTGIKASVTSLLSSEVNFSPSDTTLLLSTIDEEVDRLDRVVGNLLDMSRLHGGVLQVNAEDVPLEEIVGSAVASLGLTPDQVAISIPRSLPPVRVDDALVERAIANVLANAIAVQPAGVAVALSANVAEGDPATVELHIVDHGPGIATDDRELAVQPFQRLGDSYSHAGVGLGLAIASGMTHAIGGEMNLSDTTHGGLTVTFQLPTADDPSREDESLGEAN
ncbi:MAG TPA: DUF4118 domain-containing protein [Microthrixaceae bacterium]|nr:DUF4118 domain-containing protein [Microthrixaceae bacterium]